MQQFKIWLSAARLRTLPLSISGILVGNALCLNQPNFSWVLFVLMLFIAISFQIISNFANDYGDGIKGTDNENRVGPKRVLQQGLLSKEVLKNGIKLNSIIDQVNKTKLELQVLFEIDNSCTKTKVSITLKKTKKPKLLLWLFI